MFDPKYTITDKLLASVKRINTLVLDLNSRRFPEVVVLEFERQARALSTFASTSIEGNPLPLTEVKKIIKSHPRHIRDTEREVLNYNGALEKLNKKLAQRRGVLLTTKLILSVQKQVVAGLLPK